MGSDVPQLFVQLDPAALQESVHADEAHREPHAVRVADELRRLLHVAPVRVVPLGPVLLDLEVLLV
eukprot:11496729-Heterocapsa_arctica.AAC.1